MTKYEITALAFDRKGRLLSIGRNNYLKTHPIQAKYAQQAGEHYRIYLHAEIDALIKARKPVHRLVISRVNKAGEFMLAKPCPVCTKAIQDYGVEIVEYTI